MTDSTLGPPEPSPLDNLDGHTVDELSDYLDRGRQPRDPAIESSAEAQHALAALSRLRSVAPRVIDADATYFAPKNENWISRILGQIGVQAHAGRDIPISHDVDGAELSISEGAVRALVREAGDETDGLIVERTQLEGDVETPGAPIEIHVVVSTLHGAEPTETSAEFERLVRQAVARHTQLTIIRVTVRVHDTGLSEADADKASE